MRHPILMVVGFGVTIILIVYIISSVFGVGGFGPTNTYDVTVSRTYVDISGSEKSTESHYIVVTDKGSFEVDNGLLLGVWNADDIYGRIQAGKKYHITTKGNRYQNMWAQEFPYIVKADTL